MVWQLTPRRVLPLVALAATLLLASPATAQVGILSWLLKGERIATVGEDLSLAEKLGMATAKLSRAEVATLAGGVAGAYVYFDGSTVVLESLQDAAKSIILRADDLKTSFSHALSTVGGASPNSRILMTRSTADTLSPVLHDAIKNNKIFVLDNDFGQVPVRIEKLATGQTAMFRELVPGLYVPLNKSLGDDVVQLLKSPFRSERLRLISTFDKLDDANSIKRVTDVVGDRFSDWTQIFRSDGSVSLKPFSGETIIMMGHIEDGAFVVKGVDGSLRSIPIDLLEKAARNADVTLLSAGCNSEIAGASNGFIDYITDAGFASSLTSALDARTYAEFFGRLGSKSPFVVSDSGLKTLADENRIEIEAVKRYAKPVNFAIRTIRIFQAFRSVIEIYQMELQAFLATLFATFVLLFRRNRSAFMNNYPFLSSPKIHQFVYVSSRISREVVFLLIGPFISLLAALSIPVFGWQKRQDALSYLWSCLRRPGEFVIKALLFLSVYFIWICLLVSIVPFFISVGEVFARRGEVNLYISVALLGLGVLSFWYAQRTVPTMLIDRLVETNWPLEVRFIAIIVAGLAIVTIGLIASTTAVYALSTLLSLWS